MGLALLGTACGGGPERAAPAPKLPATVVPAKLEVGGGLVVQRNLARDTRQAIKSVGKASLAVEAGVWELRQADALVGALEVVTLDSRRVDTRRDEDRVAIRSQVLSGNPVELELAGIPVWSTVDGDRALYVFYGRQVLGVLQVKVTDVDPELAAEELVTLMVDHPAWPALDPDVFTEDDA